VDTGQHKFVVCIGAEIAMPTMHEDETTTEHAGHGHRLGPSRPHPTPTRSRTQKKEKKRSERHEGFACTKNLKPNDAKASNMKDDSGAFKFPSIYPSTDL